MKRTFTIDDVKEILEARSMSKGPYEEELANVGMIYGHRSSSKLLRSFFSENLHEKAEEIRFRH